MIKSAINKILNNSNLELNEAIEVFDEIFSGLSDEITAASFLTLLENTNYCEDYLFAGVNSAKNTINQPFLLPDRENSIENLSLDLDSRFFDVSLAQDLICSACDLAVTKYCFDSPFMKNTSFVILNLLGIDLSKKSDFTSLEFEKLNFNYFYLSKQEPFYKYSEKLNLNLPFSGILSSISLFLNPLNSKNLFLGVKSKDMVEKYASLALRLNKTNSIVLSGDNDFPFISPCGDTFIAEAWKNKIFTYVLNPELFNVAKTSIDEVLVENQEENAQNLIDILQNKNIGIKYDMVILNSALSLYIAKKADSIMDGVKIAKNMLESNSAYEKFEQIKKFYS